MDCLGAFILFGLVSGILNAIFGNKNDKKSEPEQQPKQQAEPRPRPQKSTTWHEEEKIVKKFRYRSTINGYKYFVLDDYYPYNRYGHQDITKEDDQIRSRIIDFKKGYYSGVVADNVEAAIKNIWQKELADWKPKDTVLTIIPASTKEKTEKRFKSFCTILSANLGITNGYNAIESSFDRSEMKGTKGGEKTKGLTYDTNLIDGKKVLLFDDVTTTGESFSQNAKKLSEHGADEVVGVFLGKTVYHGN